MPRGESGDLTAPMPAPRLTRTIAAESYARRTARTSGIRRVVFMTFQLQVGDDGGVPPPRAEVAYSSATVCS
jgi:hypothetical protein